MIQGYPREGCSFCKEVTTYIILQCYCCGSVLAHTHHCFNNQVCLGKTLDTFSNSNNVRLEMAKLVVMAYNISSTLWWCNTNVNHSGHERLPLDTILLRNVSPSLVNKAKLVHNFSQYVYFFSLNVLGDYVPIIRRNNYIYATLGTCYSVMDG